MSDEFDDMINSQIHTILNTRTNEVIERLERLEEKVNKKERLDKMYIGTSQDAWDKIKELEQKIEELTDRWAHTYNLSLTTSQKVDTLSAVMIKFFKYMRGYTPVGPDRIKNPFFSEMIFWNLIKQLEGEPSNKWEERKKKIANEWTEYEKKEEQEVSKRGYKAIEGIGTKEEAEPLSPNYDAGYESAIEVEIPKLIKEFLEDIDHFHGTVQIGRSNNMLREIRQLKDKWVKRKDGK